MQNETTKCEICNVDLPNKESWNTHIVGKKHQWIEQKKEAEQNGIYVRGFPRRVNQEHLKSFFSQYGTVKKFIFHANYAIIQFQDRQSAQKCLAQRLCYNGYFLYVKPREVRDFIKKGSQSQDASHEGLDHSRIVACLSSSADSFQDQLSALLKEINLTDCSKYGLICKHLEATFSRSFKNCKACPFGSTVTGLAFKGSDLDVFMALNALPAIGQQSGNFGSSVPDSSSIISSARKLLYQNSHYYNNIVAIPKAKTPIIKFIHQPTNINCDLSFKNAISVNNSALIKFYLSMDPRLQPFLIIIKYWAKRNDLSGHGKISNYALVMIALFYLQQTENPIIPNVAALQESVKEKLIIDSWECSIDTRISSSNPVNTNTLSLPELLCGFFKYYSLFDYGMKIICPLIGSALSKSLFLKPEELPEAMHRYKENVCSSESKMPGLKVECDMCIQDPFELSHNLTAGMSSKALENFKNYCGAAAKACEEILISTEVKTTSFLQKLFDESTKPPLVMTWCNEKAYITIPFSKYINHILPEKMNTTLQESQCNSEDEIRKRWFLLVLQFLTNIFENVMKFTVQIEESEHNNCKVQKLEGQSDVCDKVIDSENEYMEVKQIHCSGCYRVWEGRKSASKKLKFPGDVVPITKETIISDFLLERNKQETPTSTPITSFLCTYQPKQEPTRVILKLSDKESCKGDFKLVASFLQGRLPVWIERCFKQKYDELTILKQV